MFIIKVFYGIFLILMGAGLIKYRRIVKGWTGSFVWAERFLGNGGTYIVFICFGLFLIFVGVRYPFGGDKILGGSPTQSEFHDSKNK